MLPLLRVIVPAFLVLAAVGVLFGDGSPLSLAADLGYSQEDACRIIQDAGPDAVRRLEETGFPRPTDYPVERYRLSQARTGEAKAIIEIDWGTNHARCLPLDPATPVTVSVDMNDRAYRDLVEELRSVVTTGQHSGDWPKYVRVLLYTSIQLPEGGSEWAYKARLAKWAAGQAGGPQ